MTWLDALSLCSVSERSFRWTVLVQLLSVWVPSKHEVQRDHVLRSKVRGRSNCPNFRNRDTPATSDQLGRTRTRDRARTSWRKFIPADFILIECDDYLAMVTHEKSRRKEITAYTTRVSHMVVVKSQRSVANTHVGLRRQTIQSKNPWQQYFVFSCCWKREVREETRSARVEHKIELRERVVLLPAQGTTYGYGRIVRLRWCLFRDSQWRSLFGCFRVFRIFFRSLAFEAALYWSWIKQRSKCFALWSFDIDFLWIIALFAGGFVQENRWQSCKRTSFSEMLILRLACVYCVGNSHTPLFHLRGLRNRSPLSLRQCQSRPRRRTAPIHEGRTAEAKDGHRISWAKGKAAAERREASTASDEETVR